jgi:hypothetical protein
MMNEDIWFEEPLLPPQELVTETAKGLMGTTEHRLIEEKGLDATTLRQATDKEAFLERFVEEKAQGILRVHRPRCRLLTAQEAACIPTSLGPLQAGPLAQGELYLVRLGMEFDVRPEGREAGWAYAVAWCRAYLFSPGSREQPRVLDIYPQHLYKGEPSSVKVEVGLGLKAGPVEVQVAKISTDLHLGQVTPATTGFLGREEREPYWELRTKTKPILGVYHCWMIVERPAGCGPAHLAVLGEGDLQTRLFTIPVGPKERAWGRRESITLAA